jgi:hypothetical protein
MVGLEGEGRSRPESGDRANTGGPRSAVEAKRRGWPMWRRPVAQTEACGPRLVASVARVVSVCGRAGGGGVQAGERQWAMACRRGGRVRAWWNRI